MDQNGLRVYENLLAHNSSAYLKIVLIRRVGTVSPKANGFIPSYVVYDTVLRPYGGAVCTSETCAEWRNCSIMWRKESANWLLTFYVNLLNVQRKILQVLQIL